MGIRDKIAANVAGSVQGKAEDLFKEIIRIQESMHAHLEKLLEVQRAMYNLQRVQAKLEEIDFKDEEQ